MLRIIRYMKGQGLTVLLIIGLLLIQAYCDLSLPQYTSDIIDTGIQNKGMEHVLPEKIREAEFQYAMLFMTEEEKTEWKSVYEKDGEVYRHLDSRKKELEKEDEKFMLPILVSSQMSAVPRQQLQAQNAFQMKALPEQTTGEYVDVRPIFLELEKQGKLTKEMVDQIRSQISKTYDVMGTSLVKAMALSYTAKEAKASGVDVDQIQRRYLWVAGAKMVAMTLLMAAAAILAGLFSSKVGAGVGRNLRGRVYSNVMSFSDAEIGKFSTASLITRSTNDIQQIQMVSTMLLRMVAYAPIIGIGGVIKVMETEAGMGWVIVLAVVVIVSLVMVLMLIAMPKFKMMQKQVDRLNLVSREILTGLLVIRAFGREKKEEERFETANRDLTQTMLFTNRVMTFMMPGMMFLMYGISVLIVWVAAGKIDAGDMQVGTMTAYITYTMLIVMAFLMLTMLSIMMPRAAVAAERIDEVLNTKSTVCDQEDAEVLEITEGVVRFDHVAFRYPGAEGNVLEDIDFTAEPGKTTAIIGSTGSGKSTLIHLIPRFFDVTEGQILIDGKDIREVTQESLRVQIGYVPQKGVLFSGTIASNLSYGKENASEEEIREAAEVAQAAEFIEEKQDRYESHIAQGGTNVSGGQKQRLSIARAIARSPKIYIFDDSFSALDFKTDATLRQALGEKTQEATVFIVAQRISTILHAEQIIVLDEGRIAGIGTHEQLLKECEVYRQIARSQLSEKELQENGAGREEQSNE